VPGAGARCAPEILRHRAAEQQALDGVAKGWIVDLAREVLEESLELVDGPVGGGQELRGIEAARLEALDVLELGDHLPAKPLHPPAHAYRVTALEAKANTVGLTEDASRQRPRAVPELDRQV